MECRKQYRRHLRSYQRMTIRRELYDPPFHSLKARQPHASKGDEAHDQERGHADTLLQTFYTSNPHASGDVSVRVTVPWAASRGDWSHSPRVFSFP
jgi:hypothetical protein